LLRVLIVDDEQIERDGLKAMIRKGYPELAIEQARNGSHAIEVTREFMPDLILMDIKMPGLGGLEAVELIHGEFPHIHFMMVTAYEKFEYAREALKLGVKDYLLKPSRASEIIETVGKAIREIEEERKERVTRLTEQDTIRKMLPVIEADVVTQLLFDHVHEVHLSERVKLLGGSATNEAFVMLVFMHACPSPDLFYSAVKKKVSEYGCGWVGARSSQQIPLIVFRQEGLSYRAQAASLVQLLLQQQRRVPGTDCFIGIGNVYASLNDVRYSYQEALISGADPALQARFRFYADKPETIGQAARGYGHEQTEKRLIDHTRLGQWEQVKQVVHECIQVFESGGVPLRQAQQRVLETQWIVSRVLAEMGVGVERPLYSFNIEDYRQLRSETDCLLGKSMKAMAEHQQSLAPDIVQQIKQYIIEHSSEEVSLESIGSRVGMSPFYISKVFKEQVGVNFIDFLTECRIEKAKSLMCDPEASMKEITFEVGYNDPNYFSKVFKKMCGMTPTDYRKTMFGKKR
jgi:two-component system response regulator YesN